jgi:hypothetical protein
MVTKCAAALAGVALAGSAWCDTYVVKNAGDSPAKKTLRWAIEQANDHPGRDKIRFASWLTGKTIAPLTPLPQIIDDRTVIDGDIDRDGKPDVTLSGKKVTGGSGLMFDGAHWCTVKGLAVIAFPQRAVFFYGSDYGRIVSCHIGANRAGTRAVPNGTSSSMAGILIDTCDYCTVGGTTSAERNVLLVKVEPTVEAVRVVDGQYNTICGNYIGLAADGMSVLGTGGVGIRVSRFMGAALHNTIGGTEPGARNLFGGVEQGVVLGWAAYYSAVQGNWFGLRADGDSIASITGACVDVRDEAGENVIGGTTAGARNVFAGNAAVGVAIRGQYTHSNKVQGNYFGTNAAGTAQRRLTEGVVISDEAGPQTIGGNIPRAGNYFALKHPSKPTIAVQISAGAGDGTLIRHNRFGVRPDGCNATRMFRGINVEVAGAQVLDNLFAGTERAISANGTDVSLRIFRNTFRACYTGVDIAPGARCLLGNLGNTSTRDDGGNLFRPSNTWHIRNNSALGIKAESCRFGTTSRAAINAKLWDRRDIPALGKVDFIPLKGGVIPTGGGVVVTGVGALPTQGAGAEIVFSLSAPADVTVSVLNIAGRPMASVVRDRVLEAGTQRVLWSGRTLNGTPAPNGTYLIEVTATTADGAQARALGQVRVSR